MIRTRLALVVSLFAAFAAISGCSCNNTPVAPKLKALGVPCGADTECELGLCDAVTGNDKVCLKPCSEGCDTTDVCTGVGDDRYTCVPEKAGLCQPCQTNADCPYPADECLVLGDEHFCGRDCAFDNKCPDSFKCAPATTVTGAVVQRQCQPTSGTCQCTAASAGQKIPCENKNNSGTCKGTQTCEPATGYSACNALIPATESCNGIDDDCNGQTDENLGDETCGVGECARTVSKCVNGQPQTCIPGDAGVEICNAKDDDCDGLVDEDFDLANSLTNCGTCGAVCNPPHAVPICDMGVCKVASCLPGYYDINGMAADGCEYACTPSGAEVCDGVDNDCNGVIDDGFNKQTDVNNCGTCGRVCAPANATGACNTGNCAIGMCNPGFADCDLAYPTGCEINTGTDVNNCGSCGNICNLPHSTEACVNGTCAVSICDVGYKNCNNLPADGCEIHPADDVNNCGNCGNVCSFPHAAPSCANGTCAFTCLPNYWDIDGNPANGCEYACTKISSVDLPDMNFVDANCDGIDGEVAKSIFVSPLGNDGNPGTRALPRRTISAGVSAATLGGKRDVLVAAGAYAETVNVVNGVSVYGGYDPTNWSRSLSNTSSVNANGTALVVSGSNNSTVQFLSLFGGSATGASNTAYGAQVLNSANVKLERLTLRAGNGADGANGTTGAIGDTGGPGQAGDPGCEDSSGFCTSCNQPQGGAGGTSTCGRTGGVGGNAQKGGNTGDNGGTGTGGTSGGSGVPSGWGSTDPGTVSLSYYGSNGSPGGTGSNGINGAGFGTLSSTGYVVANTTNGSTGGHGNGGGGGGGGGGGTVDCNSYGSAGGGGGAGGCGGLGGGRGTSGGASIGIFLYGAATTPSSVIAKDLLVTTGNGGRGGNGANGGTGGPGGNPGPIGPYGGGSEQDDGSTGGRGGYGGKGGDGGRGGAGGGGPSVGVVTGANATWTPTNVTYSIGNGGLGGSNGISSGANGNVANTYP